MQKEIILTDRNIDWYWGEKMHCVLLFIALLLSGNALAEEVYPQGCRPVAIKEDIAKLTVAKPALMMVHNLSSGDLWITHPVSEPNAGAGFSSRIQAGNWSALVMSDKIFELSCVESMPGHEQQIPCRDVIAVCQWDKVKLSTEQASSTYWAGEDMGLSPLMAYLSRCGFSLTLEAQ